MPIIGTFSAAQDGYAGTIKTLTLTAKVRFVANDRKDGDSDIIRALRESTGQTTNRAGQRLIERELNVQPTLTVRPGWPLRVIVHKDLILTPYRG